MVRPSCLLAVVLLAGCGQSGDLYLPTEPAATPAVPEAAPPAPAAPEPGAKKKDAP